MPQIDRLAIDGHFKQLLKLKAKCPHLRVLLIGWRHRLRRLFAGRGHPRTAARLRRLVRRPVHPRQSASRRVRRRQRPGRGCWALRRHRHRLGGAGRSGRARRHLVARRQGQLPTAVAGVPRSTGRRRAHHRPRLPVDRRGTGLRADRGRRFRRAGDRAAARPHLLDDLRPARSLRRHGAHRPQRTLALRPVKPGSRAWALGRGRRRHLADPGAPDARLVLGMPFYGRQYAHVGPGGGGQYRPTTTPHSADPTGTTSPRHTTIWSTAAR